MDDFLMMYRSKPHSTTGISHAELLFGRKIRTKLPHLQEFLCEDEVCFAQWLEHPANFRLSGFRIRIDSWSMLWFLFLCLFFFLLK